MGGRRAACAGAAQVTDHGLEEVVARDCGDCPFALHDCRGDGCFCDHPRTRAYDIECGPDEPAPEWCPLRANPALVRLSEEEVPL